METHLNELVPRTATEYLTMAPSTQTQCDVFSDGVIQSVQAGEVNPLTVLIQLRAIAKASERILKEINSNIMTEAGKHPENKFTYAGCELTKAELGTKYDYSNCGDSFYTDLIAEKAKLDEKIKKRETWLKAVDGTENVISEDGEICTVRPPTKKSTSGVTVSIR